MPLSLRTVAATSASSAWRLHSLGTRPSFFLMVMFSHLAVSSFFAEPSSGLDPVSRRKMWKLLQAESRQRAVILTTHRWLRLRALPDAACSMEEAEALCSRVGIMINGELQCLGSPQHLKSSYGVAYTLGARPRRVPLTCCADVKVNDSSPAGMSRLQERLTGMFPGLRLSEVSASGKLQLKR